tara:strand:+ start:144 stop:482 length:339 start_codon:yes stop_codon:yes gene_type:complete
MNTHTIKSRLVAVVGPHEAQELLEAPNAALGGMTPQDMLDSGNLAPVEIMVRDMELAARSRRDFMRLPQDDIDDIDDLASDPIFDHIPQRRHSRGSGRIFAILDQLEKGGLK